MNYKITKKKSDDGRTFYELRMWGEGRGAKQVRKRFDTMEQAKAKRDELLFSHTETKKVEEEIKRTGELPDLEKPFIDEYNYYKKHLVPTFSDKWKVAIDYYEKAYLDRLAPLKIGDINPEFLDELTAEFRDAGNKEKTINLKIAWIRSILNFSLEKQRIKAHNVLVYTKLIVPEAERDFFNKQDAMSFLAFANKKYPQGSEDRWRYVVYLVAINCGLRANEIWALKPSCIMEEHMILRITEQYIAETDRFDKLKGKESRSVPLNQAILKELKALINQFSLGRSDTFFSLTKPRRPVIHGNFRHYFEKDMKEWDGPQICFHGLRHTAATLMLTEGHDLLTVSRILGHKDISTTNRYLHLIDNKVTQVAKTFSIKPEDKKPTLRIV